MENADKYIYDGNVSFYSGQNDGISSDKISEHGYRKGINVSTRDHALQPRPGFRHIEIEMEEDGTHPTASLSYSEVLKRGKFQGAAPYHRDNGNFLTVMISGILYKVDYKKCTAEIIPYEGSDRAQQYARRINWSQAGDFQVWFDYPNRPIILDGPTARRANDDALTSTGLSIPEVPAAELGTFNQNRLFSALGHQFGAGDPVGGINANAPITYEESLSIFGPYNGQFFSLGSVNRNNPITAMGFLQSVDTSTGQGPLFAATKDSIFTYRADLPREDWENTQFGRMLLYNAGIVGQRAHTNLNSDLFFMSRWGDIRSLNMGQDEQTRWGNSPISREVRGWLEHHDSELLEIAVLASYRNKVFATARPFLTTAQNLDGQLVDDYAHCGMVVLELDNVSGLVDQAVPAWAGLWTGIQPMEIVEVGDDLIFISKDKDGCNRFYILDEDISYDVFEGEKRPITSRIYTRDYDFRNPFIDKEIKNIDYTLTEIAGKFKFEVDGRSDFSKSYFKWGEFKYHAKTEICDASDDPDVPDNCGIDEPLPIPSNHSFREVDLGDPEEEDCDPVTNDKRKVVRKFGLRLTIKGEHWKLLNLRLQFERTADGQQQSISCDKFDQEKEHFSPSDSCDTVGDLDIHSTLPGVDDDECELKEEDA